MPSNLGTQTISVKYFDGVNSPVVNNIALDVRKTGIYSGGYLTKVSDVTVTLSPLTCEIGDGTYQVRAKTAADVSITVASATPYVVLRWIYTGNASADYLDFKAVAVGDILATDLIVGLCSYTGSSLTGIVYTSRNTPNVMDLFLKVEPTVAASMYVRVRAGRVNYGSVNYDIADQLTSVIVVPGSNSRIDLVQVNTSGAIVVTSGAIAASPVAPDYGGLVTLAQITVVAGQTQITASSIKDVRSFGSGGVVIPLPVASGGTGSSTKNFVDLTTAQTIAGLKTFSEGLVIENRTNDTGCTQSGRIWLRTDI